MRGVFLCLSKRRIHAWLLGKKASPNKKIKTFINGLLCSHFNCWCRCLSAYIYCRCIASLVTQTVKCLPALCETRVWFLGQEDPLEKEMATHSNILAWKIPWTKEPGRLQFMGLQKIRHDWALPFTSDVGQLFTICCCTERTGYKIICIVWWDFCNTHLYAEITFTKLKLRCPMFYSLC